MQRPLEFLYDYGLFLAQVATVLVLVVLCIALVATLSARQRQTGGDGHLEVRSLNERFDDLLETMQAQVLDRKAFRKWRKGWQKSRDGERRRGRRDRRGASRGTAGADAGAGSGTVEAQEGGGAGTPPTPPADDTGDGRPRVFVIAFDGDLEASGAPSLAHEISAVLSVAEAGDEVVVDLESQGGMVHGYGFAASQLHRVRAAGLSLTVVIDKVAASGGYMMACVGDRILAAPFAVVGSIGVIAQLPNVHRLLRRNDVDFELFTAGEFKRTVTIFGENTDAGRRKFQEEIEDVHDLFKAFVAEHRPALDLARVATGEAWHGTRALELGLVDGISTCEDYLFARREQADLYSVRWVPQQSPVERLLGQGTARWLSRWLGAGSGASASVTPSPLAHAPPPAPRL